MAEVLSPLHRKLSPGHQGAVGATGVTLGNRTVGSLWQIAGWAAFEAAATPVAQHFGLTGIGGYRAAQQSDSATSWRIAPDRLLLEGTGDLTGFGSDALVTLDLSHAKTVITLSGPAARDLLAQVVAIDTAEGVFSPGEFVQTGIHHVAVLIHCTGGDAFDILVPVTWAETVWEVLLTNARPHGVAIEGAP